MEKAISLLKDHFEDPRLEERERMKALERSFRISEESARRARSISDAAEHQLHQASRAASNARRTIASFEAALDANEEVHVAIVGGPSGHTIFPEQIIPMVDTDQIALIGKDGSGRKALLLQHVSQLNLLLVAARVEKGEARRVGDLGFHSPKPSPA